MFTNLEAEAGTAEYSMGLIVQLKSAEREGRKEAVDALNMKINELREKKANLLVS